MTQSPASDDDSALEPRGQVDTVREDYQPGRDDTELSGLEMWRDPDRKTEVSERDAGAEQGPDEADEETFEGRLSTDTSEQIFVGQQIEAKTALDGPGEIADQEFISRDMDEPAERVAVPTDLLDLSADTTDRLQSPKKTSSGIAFLDSPSRPGSGA